MCNVAVTWLLVPPSFTVVPLLLHTLPSSPTRRSSDLPVPLAVAGPVTDSAWLVNVSVPSTNWSCVADTEMSDDRIFPPLNSSHTAVEHEASFPDRFAVTA